MSKVKQNKCEHNNVYHVQQVDGNSSTHIFECHDCNEYIFVDEIDSPYDWDNACVVSDTIVIADSSLKIDSFNVQSITCFNGNDAVVEISVIGGVPAYSYLWSNSDTTKVIDSVSNGWYYVNITDSANCFVLDSIFIDHPDTLQFDILRKKSLFL